jgi:hypothetical protein
MASLIWSTAAWLLCLQQKRALVNFKTQEDEVIVLDVEPDNAPAVCLSASVFIRCKSSSNKRKLIDFP